MRGIGRIFGEGSIGFYDRARLDFMRGSIGFYERVLYGL